MSDKAMWIFLAVIMFLVGLTLIGEAAIRDGMF